jgi:hypothetical protein
VLERAGTIESEIEGNGKLEPSIGWLAESDAMSFV